jgi:hypothetical protein
MRKIAGYSMIVVPCFPEGFLRESIFPVLAGLNET